VSIEAIAGASGAASDLQAASARVRELEALEAEASAPRGPSETASFAAVLAAAGEEAGGGGGGAVASAATQALAERTGGTAAPGLSASEAAGPGALLSPYATGASASTPAPYPTAAAQSEGAAAAGVGHQAPASYPGSYRSESLASEGVSQAAVQSAGAAPYAQAISRAAIANGIEPAILFGLIEQESGFDPQARSSAGALGLTQLMPATAASLGVREPLDPWEAIAGGARYLGQLLREFHGNIQDALAAYNAGPGAVSAAGGVPPIAETEAYVSDVLANARRFRGE